MLNTLQNEILKLKKELDFCILAHSYQAHEILEIADYTGDSFKISVDALDAPQKNILLCGVRFMAETAKLLSPEKKVYLSHSEAGCPMAEQIDREMVQSIKEKHPEYTVVAYINTTTELKTVCDVCVTSSSAVKIIKKLPGKDIFFIPDRNLGSYVAKQIPEKNFIFMQGGCPIHAQITAKEAIAAKNAHPGAKLLVHPECVPAVTELADYVGSTSGIMEYAKNSPEKEFIIGTELSIAEHLMYECPDKFFFPLSKHLVCPNMRLTTLPDVKNVLLGKSGEEITLPEETMISARKCIDEMIRLG